MPRHKNSRADKASRAILLFNIHSGNLILLVVRPTFDTYFGIVICWTIQTKQNIKICNFFCKTNSLAISRVPTVYINQSMFCMRVVWDLSKKCVTLQWCKWNVKMQWICKLEKTNAFLEMMSSLAERINKTGKMQIFDQNLVIWICLLYIVQSFALFILKLNLKKRYTSLQQFVFTHAQIINKLMQLRYRSD